MQNVDAPQLFATLSNETRLRCLNLAFHNPEVCVCEAVAALGISQPAISKAMAALRSANLLESRRDANWTYYRMHPGRGEWLDQLVKLTVSKLAARPPYCDDQQRFLALDMRGAATASPAS